MGKLDPPARNHPSAPTWKNPVATKPIPVVLGATGLSAALADDRYTEEGLEATDRVDAREVLRADVSRHAVSDIGEAVVHRLRRGGVEQARVGEAIAVLGAASTTETIAVVLQQDPNAVDRILVQLTASAIVEAGRFRHREVGRCILRGMRVDARRLLHHRAAAALHDRDAPAAIVAEHLVRSGETRYPWAAAILRTAADEALALDEIDRAVECLELAYRTAIGAAERAEIAAVLASIEWRINPSTATRNFARLHAAVRAGTLSAPALHAAVRYLLWHGRMDDARAAWRLLERDARPALPDAAAPDHDELTFLRSWIAYTYPEVPLHQQVPVAKRPRTANEGTPSLHLVAANLLSAIAADAGRAATVPVAHQILSRHRLDSGTVEALTTALEGLIYADKLEVATAWCDALLAESVARSSPTWQAIFAGLRAEIALRQGRLDDAAGYAVQALNQVPAGNLGTVVGRPLWCYVRALTAAGRYTEAQAQLDREVPLSLFDSRLALPYLHARGHLALATARVADALVDFQLCGSLMRRWKMDLPALVPWRNDLALGYLMAGDHHRARGFAERHLVRLGDARRHGTGAVSLRLIAATVDPSDRIALLRQAETIARRSDDRLELATVLADLGRTHEMLGEVDRSRSLRRSALRLAVHCGAEPLVRRLSGDQTEAVQPVRATAALDIGSLSSAEHRVAEMAAKGLRNREIAEELEITTSTVEQHLTRVYRKLKVRRRTELRFMLSTKC
ncbi:helix-turn-helix transcriptional regulator [Nocardia anaemiae]|uniref:helix-turn-helix transcriptional regulator n=1 Tax=Nocardia anaemiae TaxID=263910 RepID=UPI0007A41C0F|nr:helix-turn-helix transcriptional regulator [Nocardia anaemiae]